MSNFLERRRRFLQLMAIRYGFITSEMDIQSLMTATLDYAESKTISIEDALSIIMTSALESKTAKTFSTTLAITFAINTNATTPQALAIVPIEFESNLSTDTNIKAPMQVKIEPNSIELALLGQCGIDTFTAQEIGLASQLVTLTTNAIISVATPILSSITKSYSFSANTSAKATTSKKLGANSTNSLTATAQVANKTAENTTANIVGSLSFSANMSCVKKGRLSDFDNKQLANITGELCDLEYITF